MTNLPGRVQIVNFLVTRRYGECCQNLAYSPTLCLFSLGLVWSSLTETSHFKSVKAMLMALVGEWSV